MATADEISLAHPSHSGSNGSFESFESFESFLQLPSEIRTIIYSHIIHNLVVAINEPLKAPETSILRCNRLVRQEAKSILYQLAYFRANRQDFYDLIFAVPPTVTRLKRVQDLPRIRNIVITSFEVNKLLYNTSNFGSCDSISPIALSSLRKVQIELEVCSCGPVHFSIRRRSCAEVQRGQHFQAVHNFLPTDLHGDKSYAARTILRNMNKLREQVEWMQNAKGYDIAIKMVMMDTKGKASMPEIESSREVQGSDKEWNCDMVAILMITRRGVEIVEGEEDIAVEASKLLIDHLGIGLDFETCLSA